MRVSASPESTVSRHYLACARRSQPILGVAHA